MPPSGVYAPCSAFLLRLRSRRQGETSPQAARGDLQSRLAAGLAAVLLGVMPAGAAVTHVGSSSTAANGATNTATVALPAGVVLGDLLLAQVTQRGATAPTITPPAGWTQVTSQTNASTLSMVIYRKVATAAEPASYTWTFSVSDRIAAAVVAFRDVETTTPVNVSASQSNAASTSYTAPSLTPTEAGTMLVAFYVAPNGNGSVTAATGMTAAYSAGNGAGSNGQVIGASYAVQSASGASGTKVSGGNASLTSLGALVALRDLRPGVLAEFRMDELSWNGSVGEVVDSTGNYSTSASSRVAPVPTTANASPAVAAASGTCRYGVFSRTTGSVLTLPASFPNLGATSSFTVTAWIRSTNVALSGQRIFIDDDSNSGGYGISLGDAGAGTLRFYTRGAPSGLILDTANVVANNTWYFVAAVVDIANKRKWIYVYSAAGAQLAAATRTFTEANIGSDSGRASIGNESAASGEYTASYGFAGDIDEVRVYPAALSALQLASVQQDTRACAAAGPDHYELSLATSSLACLPTTVTVTACANNSSPCTSPATTVSGATATLATSGATLGATTVSFNASGVATTTLSFPAASNGTAVSVTLGGESMAASNARQCCANGASCSIANSCSTTFNTAGFVVAALTGGAAATVPTQTAGTPSSTYQLRAVQTNTNTKACEAALVGANTVNWALQCNNPATCSAGNLMTVTGSGGVPVASNPSSGVTATTAVPMTFDAAGNAPFSFNYANVGQVTLSASKAVNSATLNGSTNAFVVRPASFVLSSVRQTASPNTANPAASNAGGSRFVQAGESFSATLTATTSAGIAAPNFGRENIPEGVLLTPTLVLPSGGAAGTLSNGSIAGGSFSNGVATITNLSFSEVGIITLAPTVVSGSYLGAGAVIGTTSANIGRFVPARFTLAGGSVTHRAMLSCAPASAFSYLGENFRLALTLTAQNSAGATTQNYAGAFAKLDPTAAAAWNLLGRDGTTVFSTNSGRLSLGSATGSWSNGVASGVTISANASRATAPDGPFNAVFGVAPTDSDGVVLAAFDLASSAGGSNNRASVAVVPLRFGRLLVYNAIGPADRALVLPVAAQHWTGSTFDTNAMDSCTVLPTSAFSFGNLRRGLTAADTSATAAVTLAAGRGALRLAAPLAGRSGTFDVAASLGGAAVDASCLQPWAPDSGDAATVGAGLTYLRGAWCGSGFANDPAARATFGLGRGSDAQVYRRENY